MKIKIIFLLISFFSVLTSYGQNGEKVIFTDSVTSVQLFFPQHTEFKNISNISFRKGTAILKESNISIYSMKSPEGKQYSWTRINEFDNNAQYGHLIRKEKIKDSPEGWFRYYQNETKDGEKYITCITLIRGDVYAIYLVESALKEEYLSSKEVVASSFFPNSTGVNKTRKDSLSTKDWIIVIVSLLCGLCFWNLKQKMSNTIKIPLILLSGIAIFIYLHFFAWVGIWTSCCTSITIILFWVLCFYSKSWNDFWKHIEKTFDHM